MKRSIGEWLAGRWLNAEVERRVKQAVRALDDSGDLRLSNGRFEERERGDADREEVLRQSLEAWRVNPLARRVVELTTHYTVGSGLGVACEHAGTHAFVQRFWNHRLNRMNQRVVELCDELTRAGEVFLLVTTDAAGMSYVRSVPALEVAGIETAENDSEQERAYTGRMMLGGGSQRWAGYDPQNDDGQTAVMLHYAINRPAGALRGESDLAPLLRWLARYAAWLEDRARLNRYRFAFLYMVTMRGSSEVDRRRRQMELSAAPPSGGSMLVKDENEEWSVLAPNLAAGEAAEDGLSLKKMIAAGAGVPMHFLAEPEGATRTTAESAGGPTFRKFEQRQQYFLWLVRDLLEVVVRRAALAGCPVDTGARIEVRGTDVSARDNADLAAAAGTVVSAFERLRDRGLIDDAELLRLAYRFAGEVVDVPALLERGRAAGTAQIEAKGGRHG